MTRKLKTAPIIIVIKIPEIPHSGRVKTEHAIDATEICQAIEKLELYSPIEGITEFYNYDEYLTKKEE